MSLLRIVAALTFLMVSAAAAMADAFPVTFTHKFGTTTINAPPVRVVSLGYAGGDNILALGVKPVALRYWYGDYPYGVWPWAQAALGDAKPESLKGDLNIEQIAALKPDVILAVSSGITREQYDLLSQIAPTIAPEAEYGDYGTPWQVDVRTSGKALGKSAEAESLIAGVESRLAAIRAAHPDWQGKSAAVATYWNNAPGAYRSIDLRPRLLNGLGFVTPAAIDAAGPADEFYVTLSSEDLSPLDADILIWFDEDNTVSGLKLRPNMRAYKEGREIFPDAVLSGAFSFSSLLSINYVLDQMEPMIAAAIDGDPSTIVHDTRNGASK